jgi:hypothetical protein
MAITPNAKNEEIKMIDQYHTNVAYLTLLRAQNLVIERIIPEVVRNNGDSLVLLELISLNNEALRALGAIRKPDETTPFDLRSRFRNGAL